MPEQLELFPEHESGPAPSPPGKGALVARIAPSPAVTLPDPKAQAESLREALARRTGMQVDLRITDNSSTMMSVRYVPGARAARLSLHHMFLEAPAEMLEALAHWIRHPRGRKHAELFSRFIRDNQHRVAPKAPRPATVQTAGAWHDLRALYDEVNAVCFGGRVDAPITWGKAPPARRRRSIRLGSYSPAEHLIRIHPHLDAEHVPRFFVRYIVFHEMLHADMGIEELPSGRRAVHPPRFRARERDYPDYARAVAWMENPRNLGRLLRGGRR